MGNYYKYLVWFVAGPHAVARAGLELTVIGLPLPPERWKQYLVRHTKGSPGLKVILHTKDKSRRI